MTAEEAKAKQEEIAKHFDLHFWYGTWCKKCCGVYPKLMTEDNFRGWCWYECEVCGTRTEPQVMPWVARDEWNEGHFMPTQMTLF